MLCISKHALSTYRACVPRGQKGTCHNLLAARAADLSDCIQPRRYKLIWRGQQCSFAEIFARPWWGDSFTVVWIRGRCNQLLIPGVGWERRKWGPRTEGMAGRHANARCVDLVDLGGFNPKRQAATTLQTPRYNRDFGGSWRGWSRLRKSPFSEFVLDASTAVGACFGRLCTVYDEIRRWKYRLRGSHWLGTSDLFMSDESPPLGK